MARFRLSTLIAAPIEDVYRRVTAYGEDGPLGEEAFQKEYGEVLEQEGNSYVVREDVRRYPDDPPELITWRCTFDFPESRNMESLDSVWAHRRDTFRSDGEGTMWRVDWDTRVGGLRGIIQYLSFRIVGHRRTRRHIMGPVQERFDRGRDTEAEGR